MIKCYIYVKTATIDIPKDCNQRNDILGSKDWHELHHFRRKEKNGDLLHTNKVFN